MAGLGMALLYPNLSAVVADIAHPSWRPSAIGIYRFWRDLGYGFGAFGLGGAAAVGGHIESAFWLVAIANVGVRRGAVVLGRRDAPAPEPGRLSDLRITWPAPERPPPATSSIHRQRSTLNAARPGPHEGHDARVGRAYRGQTTHPQGEPVDLLTATHNTPADRPI